MVTRFLRRFMVLVTVFYSGIVESAEIGSGDAKTKRSELLAPNETDNLVQALNAQKVGDDFFKKNPNAVFIEPAMSMSYRPKLYPNAAAATMQAISVFNNDKPLFEGDGVETVKDEIKELQYKLEFIKNKSYPKEYNYKHFPNGNGKFVRDEIKETIENSEEIKKLGNSNDKESYSKIMEKETEISWEIARQHVLDPSSGMDYEQAKQIEFANAKKLLSYYYEFSERSAVSAYLLMQYGKWEAPDDICRSANNFLQSRMIMNKKLIFRKDKITLPEIEALIKRGLPVILRLKLEQLNDAYICILGFNENVVLTALITKDNPTDAPYVSTDNTDWIYKIDWKNLKDKITGYFVYKTTTKDAQND